MIDHFSEILGHKLHDNIEVLFVGAVLVPRHERCLVLNDVWVVQSFHYLQLSVLKFLILENFI